MNKFPTDPRRKSSASSAAPSPSDLILPSFELDIEALLVTLADASLDCKKLAELKLTIEKLSSDTNTFYSKFNKQRSNTSLLIHTDALKTKLEREIDELKVSYQGKITRATRLFSGFLQKRIPGVDMNIVTNVMDSKSREMNARLEKEKLKIQEMREIFDAFEDREKDLQEKLKTANSSHETEIEEWRRKESKWEDEKKDLKLQISVLKQKLAKVDVNLQESFPDTAKKLESQATNLESRMTSLQSLLKSLPAVETLQQQIFETSSVASSCLQLYKSASKSIMDVARLFSDTIFRQRQSPGINNVNGSPAVNNVNGSPVNNHINRNHLINWREIRMDVDFVNGNSVDEDITVLNEKLKSISTDDIEGLLVSRIKEKVSTIDMQQIEKLGEIIQTPQLMQYVKTIYTEYEKKLNEILEKIEKEVFEAGEIRRRVLDLQNIDGMMAEEDDEEL
ncbi:hypothetical protein HK098_001721 [Nowakowskiella sp. JEL0407]|nr:hypothetical protein HK098_001721 [Nowakowskiella sp. JEL0407]